MASENRSPVFAMRRMSQSQLTSGPRSRSFRSRCSSNWLRYFVLLGARGFARNDGLARWVALYQTLIDSIEDGALQLMVEIHCRLPFVADGKTSFSSF